MTNRRIPTSGSFCTASGHSVGNNASENDLLKVSIKDIRTDSCKFYNRKVVNTDLGGRRFQTAFSQKCRFATSTKHRRLCYHPRRSCSKAQNSYRPEWICCSILKDMFTFSSFHQSCLCSVYSLRKYSWTPTTNESVHLVLVL